MEVNYNVLNEMLAALLETDDISLTCKKELTDFLQNRDINVFSEENLKQLSGIFMLSIKPAYEATTGKFIPNIFAKLD